MILAVKHFRPMKSSFRYQSSAMLIFILLILLSSIFAQTAKSPSHRACPANLTGAPYHCIEADLTQQLLTNYQTTVPPIVTFKQGVKVSTGLNVYKIQGEAEAECQMTTLTRCTKPFSHCFVLFIASSFITSLIAELNIREGTMQLAVWIRMSWTDPRLAWNRSIYNISAMSFYASNDKEVTDIWVADLELYNQADSIYNCADKNAIIYHTGFVFWSRPCTVYALCNFQDLSQMPFDNTNCFMEFGGWTRSGWDVNYVLAANALAFATEASAKSSYQEYQLDESKR